MIQNINQNQIKSTTMWGYNLPCRRSVLSKCFVLYQLYFVCYSIFYVRFHGTFCTNDANNNAYVVCDLGKRTSNTCDQWILCVYFYRTRLNNITTFITHHTVTMFPFLYNNKHNHSTYYTNNTKNTRYKIQCVCVCKYKM